MTRKDSRLGGGAQVKSDTCWKAEGGKRDGGVLGCWGGGDLPKVISVVVTIPQRDFLVVQVSSWICILEALGYWYLPIWNRYMDAECCILETGPAS